jgi:hypothetical protein
MEEFPGVRGSIFSYEAAPAPFGGNGHRQRGTWQLLVFLAILFACADQTVPAADAPREHLSTPTKPRVSIILAQIPFHASNGDSLRAVLDAGFPDLPGGSRIAISTAHEPGGRLVVLTSSFDAAGRPALSFDATRILFVGRRGPDDRLNVWEMVVDGGDLRQITHEPASCGRAVYLSSLFTNENANPFELICYSALTERGVSQIFTCRLDGTGRRQITFAPNGATDPLLLSDGKLLFHIFPSAHDPANSTYHGSSSRPIPNLFTTNIDGADLSLFATGGESPVEQSMPCESDDGRVLFVETNRSDPDTRSTIVAVDRAQSLSTRREVFTIAAGCCATPASLPDGRILISKRDVDASSFDVFLFDPLTPSKYRVMVETPDWHEVYPIAVLPRTRPPARSSVVDDRASTGFIYCLDAKMSDSPHEKTRPAPPARRVRVLRPSAWEGSASAPLSPARSDKRQSDDARDTELGTADIEGDGSFFLEVPARMPLRLETLDEAGEVLSAMRNWFWVMPKETRGCIGCHEDREWSPPNRHVLALRKRPVRIGVGDERPSDSPEIPPPRTGYQDRGKVGQVP